MAKGRFEWIPGIIKKLDELLFNFRGSAGKEYQGTSMILYLPAFAGLITGIYCFVYSLSSNKIPLGHIDFIMYAVWLLNEIFLKEHVFKLPGVFRKFFYPVFVAVITIPVFSMIFGGTIMLCSIFPVVTGR